MRNKRLLALLLAAPTALAAETDSADAAMEMQARKAEMPLLRTQLPVWKKRKKP